VAEALLAEHRPRVYGEFMAEMPRDLYIPPDALEIILDSFEGPLDLLLYLIRRANINVLDIPMAPLTAQYLVYVEAMRKGNLELAAEYLLMAAMLIEIKSRMLLPRPPKAENGEPEDPRAELVRRLIEYERMKASAAKLDELPQVGRDYEWITVWIADKVVERQPDVSLHDLQVAWLSLMKQARVHQHHKIHPAPVAGRRLCGVRPVVRHHAGRPGDGGELPRHAGAGARIADRNYPERGPCAHLRETARCCRCINPKTTSACWKPRCWWPASHCPWPS
jgi:segregation and condensation protein A